MLKISGSVAEGTILLEDGSQIIEIGAEQISDICAQMIVAGIAVRNGLQYPPVDKTPITMQ